MKSGPGAVGGRSQRAGQGCDDRTDRLTSGRLALIAYTGRKSGDEHTIPVLYRDKGDEVTIAVGWPEHKLWWRNLTGEGGPVRLVVRGQELRGHAVATRDPGRDALVRVRVESRD